MACYICDKYGYIVDEYVEDCVTNVTDFMYPHDYMRGKKGDWFYCHGYNTVMAEDPEQHNCRIAQSIGGYSCQCGKCREEDHGAD